MRVLFWGTPEFAVPPLRALLGEGFEVCGVVTQPDKPVGRSRSTLEPPPIKKIALEESIPVFQPEKPKGDELMAQLTELAPDISVVVAYGHILSTAVIDLPKLGTINIHARLLPALRGAAPINWAIINGEKETGVTTFFLKHEIDTGNILFQEKEPILPEDDAGTLYERLMDKGAGLVLKTVKAIESGAYNPQSQITSQELKHAPKIFRETCMIDWNRRSQEIVNFVRGLSPYPGAWTTINDKTYKIFKVSLNDTGIKMKTADGFVFIEELQPEGKKRMKAADFLRGYKL